MKLDFNMPKKELSFQPPKTDYNHYNTSEHQAVYDYLNGTNRFKNMTEDAKWDYIKRQHDVMKTKGDIFESFFNNPCIVKDSKIVHIGKIMGHVHNGGGSLALGNNIAIKFIRGLQNPDFVKIEVLEYGIQHKPSEQTWSRTKTKTVKKEVYKKPKKEQMKQAQMDVQIEESEDLF